MYRVRAATPADYAEWRPLWDGYNAFYGRLNATALPEEITQATWARFFDPAEPVFALVAQREGRGVGRALIVAVYGEAAAAGSTRVYWHTQAGNVTGRALYDKVAQDSGFAVYVKGL